MDFIEGYLAQKIVKSPIIYDKIDIVPDERFYSMTQVILRSDTGYVRYSHKEYQQIKTDCELYYYHLVENRQITRPDKLIIDRKDLSLKLRKLALDCI